jgi:hypothetical protein
LLNWRNSCDCAALDFIQNFKFFFVDLLLFYF